MTGDPTIDTILQWLQSGASLDNIGAVAAIGALLRFIIVPVVETLLKRFFGMEFASIYKLQMVNVCGVLTTIAIGLGTHTQTPFSQQILIGMLAAASAVGMHQLTSQSRIASLAVAEKNKTTSDDSRPTMTQLKQ